MLLHNTMSIRTALVTGSANGIGRAIALRLAQDGFQIAINDLASQEVKLRELQYELELKGQLMDMSFSQIPPTLADNVEVCGLLFLLQTSATKTMSRI